MTTSSTHANRIAIIGAGHVGATTAYALMLSAIVGEIVLIDSNEQLAVAEALDIEHANALCRPARVWAGGYADAAQACVAIITAGAMMKLGESRLAVLDRSAMIVRSCVRELMAAGFDGVLIVAANPVDIMAQSAQELSGLPVERVLGSGTLLDSARLGSMLGAKLGLDPRSISAYVLGEHGDSEIAAFSIAQVGCTPLAAYLGSAGSLDEAELQEAVRRAGFRIFAGKGFTSYGVATAVVRICTAIVGDEHAVLPVSSLTTGQYGISGVYLSLPCVVGARGVERLLAPPLGESEVRGLRASAQVLSATYAALQEHARSQARAD